VRPDDRRFSVLVRKASSGATIVFAVRDHEAEALLDVTRLRQLGLDARSEAAGPGDVPGLERRRLARFAQH